MSKHIKHKLEFIYVYTKINLCRRQKYICNKAFILEHRSSRWLLSPVQPSVLSKGQIAQLGKMMPHFSSSLKKWQDFMLWDIILVLLQRAILGNDEIPSERISAKHIMASRIKGVAPGRSQHCSPGASCSAKQPKQFPTILECTWVWFKQLKSRSWLDVGKEKHPLRNISGSTDRK